MSKSLFSIVVLFVMGFFTAFSAVAQNAAEAGENLDLSEYTTVLPENDAASLSLKKSEENIAAKSLKTEEVSNEFITSKEDAKKLARQAKVEKFLKSKTGQWIIKKASIKAHKKQVRKQLKELKGDKEAKQALKEKSKKEVVEIKAMNSNVRTGIILIAIGIILTILPVDIIRVVGSILIVIGLVFIILGLV